MFTRQEAERLREQLTPLDFEHAAPESELLTRYRRHYGIDSESLGLEFTHHIGVISSNEYTVVCQYFCLPRVESGTAFLLHGYYDHVGLFGHLIQYCLGCGISVVIFDFPGHGLSSGKPASIGSFQEYCEAFTDCLGAAKSAALPRPWVAVGQSTGSAVVMDSFQHHKLQSIANFEQSILLCPLLYPVGWSLSRFVFYLTRWFLPGIRRSFARNSHDEDFLAFLRNSDELQSKTLPTAWVAAMVDYQKRFLKADSHASALHIIQGTDDNTVDWKKNLPLIARKFPASKTYFIEGARHHMVNESLAYRDKIFAKLGELIGRSDTADTTD